MYDLFVLGCLIVIMLFIVYNFYIDFTNKKNFKDNINFFLPKLKKIF